jgi:hypothetical protein
MGTTTSRGAVRGFGVRATGAVEFDAADEFGGGYAALSFPVRVNASGCETTPVCVHVP